jgi:hypothetical protein
VLDGINHLVVLDGTNHLVVLDGTNHLVVLDGTNRSLPYCYQHNGMDCNEYNT